MTESRGRKQALAIRVVAAAMGGSAAMAGPEAAVAGAAITPILETGLAHIFDVVNERRYEQAAQTLTDAADDFGSQTDEEFLEFIEAAISDAEHQELLARALTIAQDTAMRDKRRALGRALASAASDTGTKVDEELLFIRVLADLDEPHIRLLRRMSTPPPSLDALNRQQRISLGKPPIRQWHPLEIAELEPGLADVMWGLLPVLDRLRLIDGNEAEYTINGYGEFVLARLAEPESRAER